MKKILLMIVPLMALIGCSYDDTDIQKRLDDLDGQLTELQALVKALNSDEIGRASCRERVYVQV